MKKWISNHASPQDIVCDRKARTVTDNEYIPVKRLIVSYERYQLENLKLEMRNKYIALHQ